MYISHYGKKTCRTIVHFGSKVVIHCGIKHKKTRKTRRVSNKRKGHLVGTLESELSGNTSKSRVIVGNNNNQSKYECSAPLLRADETLEAGTLVIIMQSESGQWHIIAAQCPEDDEEENSDDDSSSEEDEVTT